MTAAIKFRVNDEYYALIYPVGKFNEIDWANEEECTLGSDYRVYGWKNPSETSNLLRVVEGLNGENILRLVETKNYIAKIRCSEEIHVELPSLQNEGNKSLKCSKDENSVTFQFVNYLGISRISFKSGNGYKVLPFEVVPDKMDFEDDYIEITESLAKHCAELLLDYSGSTSNLFTLSDDSAQSLLEQFIFLRQFCYSENLEGLFAAVKRNPDRILIERDEFRPLGCGMPSKNVYTHPFSYAKGWNRYQSRSSCHAFFLPSEVVVTHKEDSLDTPANRFLKFALEKFNFICEMLVLALDSNKADQQTECRLEAVHIHHMIDDILQDSFFDDIGPLDIMPQNNQVLQKREGYSQILSAYCMMDLALQLDWKGKDSVYKGESKNVALLYEYWLFFELCKVVRTLPGCIMVTDEQNPFMRADQGRLIISLKEGKQSCQPFVIHDKGIKINLYYNRTFSPAEFRTTRYEGSYSRPFRPDYTLAVFPEQYCHRGRNGESEAVLDGAVSYIHFDAKYRVTDLTSFIGKDETTEKIDNDFNEEKTEEIVNTYKRGDLLKMHTYNDAIRRTIGSYVLYPGNASQKGYVFRLYDEILPGVGAFALKPGIQKQGEEVLRDFILKLINQKVERSSRLNRMKYYSDMVIQEPSSSYALHNEHQLNETHTDELERNLCVIGYLRADSPSDYYYSLVKNGLLRNGREFLFYYYAIRGNVVYTHHHDIARAGFFRFYTNRIIEEKRYVLEPVLCRIVSSGLVSRADLVKQLNSQGYPTTVDNHHADFYYILKVRVMNDNCPSVSLAMRDVNSVNGNDSISPHSPKVLHSDGLIGNTLYVAYGMKKKR